MKAEYYPTIKSSDDSVKLVDVEINWHKDDTLRLKPGAVAQFVDSDNRLILVVKKDDVDDDTKELDGDFLAFKFNRSSYKAKTKWENKKPVYESIEPTTVEKEIIKAFSGGTLPSVCKVIKAILNNGTAETVEDLGTINAVIKFDNSATVEQLIDPSIITEVKRSTGGYSRGQTAKEIFADKLECFNSLFDKDGNINPDIYSRAGELEVKPWEVIKSLLS